MDDVLGHVVLAPGDEDLGAGHLETAIGLRLSPRAHSSQIAASLRLGQVHGAGPLAADQIFKVDGLELIRAGGQQRFNGTVCQQGTQGKTHVGRVLHFAAGGANRLGQALAAEIDRVLQTLPAGFCKLLKRFLEARCCRDLAVGPTRGILVTLPVQRTDDALVELGRLFQHCLGRVKTGVLKTRQSGDLLDIGQVLDIEKHVLQRGNVAHGKPPVIIKNFCAGFRMLSAPAHGGKLQRKSCNVTLKARRSVPARQ